MHPFVIETNQIVTHLEEAYSKIQAINNPDMAWLQNKILLDLKRHITSLKLQLGQEPVATPLPNPHRGPLKKMFGKDITTAPNRPRDLNKPFHQSAEEVDAAELRLKADELYPKFLITASDQLMDSVTDIEIRAVAKRAGLPVTETNPQNISVAYIDEIKAAIQQQNTANHDANNELPFSDHAIGTNTSPAAENNPRSVEFLYEEFTQTENKDILDVYSDIEIRAVAKRAGLPVTETFPAKIDARFVNQVKAAIKKQREFNDKAGNV